VRHSSGRKAHAYRGYAPNSIHHLFQQLWPIAFQLLWDSDEFKPDIVFTDFIWIFDFFTLVVFVSFLVIGITDQV
jgi:hypothetical protein